MAAPYPWEEQPASRWTRDFSNSRRDSRVPLPMTQLEQEGIGEKTTVHDLFDRWVLHESVHAGRGTHYAEVTKDCRGKIELAFALTPEQWSGFHRDDLLNERFFASKGYCSIGSTLYYGFMEYYLIYMCARPPM